MQTGQGPQLVSVGYRLQVGDIVWGKEDIRHME